MLVVCLSVTRCVLRRTPWTSLMQVLPASLVLSGAYFCLAPDFFSPFSAIFTSSASPESDSVPRSPPAVDSQRKSLLNTQSLTEFPFCFNAPQVGCFLHNSIHVANVQTLKPNAKETRWPVSEWVNSQTGRFHRRKHRRTINIFLKCTTSLVIREIKIKSTLRCNLSPP